MKNQRIGILCVDVIKLDLERKIAFLAYDLRAPVGDNHSACDVGIDSTERMCDELFAAARAKAALLSKVFSGKAADPDDYMIKDRNATVERIRPLFERVRKALDRQAAGAFDEADRIAAETDGVHLLRPEWDIESVSLDERFAVLLRRAERYLKERDFEPARLMAERALRLRPDSPEARDVLARGKVEA
ncbi:MAG: hypothetical protein FJX76_00130 [Armatimonadetes bacterium]|nr:hypothetical protein [Armatimonadota bacterium]